MDERPPNERQANVAGNPGPPDAASEAGPHEAARREDPEDRPGALLDSQGRIECPRCRARFWLESVTLGIAGARPQQIRLDLRYPDAPLDEVVNQVKRTLVIRALRQAEGVKSRAAEIAGMKYTTFYELVQRLGVTDREVFGDDTAQPAPGS